MLCCGFLNCTNVSLVSQPVVTTLPLILLWFFQALHGHENNTAQTKADSCLSSTSQFSSFSPFNCGLSVVLYLDKVDYPKIRLLYFVLINTVSFNLLSVWVFDFTAAPPIFVDLSSCSCIFLSCDRVLRYLNILLCLFIIISLNAFDVVLMFILHLNN